MVVKQNEVETKIGIIGGVGSGKSTYLGALNNFSLQYKVDQKTKAKENKPHHSYAVRNKTDESEKNFYDISEALAEGKFPPASSSIPKNFDFDLYNGFTISVHVETTDRSGGDFDVNSVNYEKMINYLIDCQGLIFFFSLRRSSDAEIPMMEYRKLHILLDNIVRKINKQNQSLETDGNNTRIYKLPHRVAICFTQYDDVDFFDFAQKNGIVTKAESYNGIKNVPQIKRDVNDNIDINALKQILSWFGDWENTLSIFDNYFHWEKINYFAVSSIGFYYENNQGCKTVPWDNCHNIEMRNENGPGQKRIRSAPDFYPMNLFDPVAWLVSKKQQENNYYQYFVNNS